MSWLSRRWRSIGAAVCGVGSAVATHYLGLETGAAIGGVCTAIFGISADTWRKLALDAFHTPHLLSASEREKLIQPAIPAAKLPPPPMK